MSDCAELGRVIRHAIISSAGHETADAVGEIDLARVVLEWVEKSRREADRKRRDDAADALRLWCHSHFGKRITWRTAWSVTNRLFGSPTDQGEGQ